MDARKIIATAARSAAVFAPGSTGFRATRMHSMIKTITHAIMPPAMSFCRGTRSTINMDRTLATNAVDTQHADKRSWVERPYPSPA